jgi:hypothetical protein
VKKIRKSRLGWIGIALTRPAPDGESAGSGTTLSPRERVDCSTCSPGLAKRVSVPRKSALRPLPSAFRLLHSAHFLLLSAYCLLPGVLHAQGCAMCYTSASAAKSAAKEALFNGTLILLAPPVLIIAIIIVVIFRYRNKFRDVSGWRSEHDRELREMLAGVRRG